MLAVTRRVSDHKESVVFERNCDSGRKYDSQKPFTMLSLIEAEPHTSSVKPISPPALTSEIKILLFFFTAIPQTVCIHVGAEAC